MKYIEFGSEKKKVSRLILGMMRVNGKSVADIEKLINTALENGINFIDTADIYAKGESESLIGGAFVKNPGLRDKVWLQTKCAIRKDPGLTYFDFSKDYIIKCVEDSLSRLKTDCIDSLLLHRPDALMEPEELAEAFGTLKQQGKVLEFGVSNQNPAQMRLTASRLDFKLVANQIQLSCAFTPALDAGFNVNMENDAAVMREGGVLEYCHLHDIPVQTWSVLQYGFFEGVFLGSEKFPELNKVLDRIAEEKKVSASAVAVAWILRLPQKMQAVVGTMNPLHLTEIAAAADIQLSRSEWYEIYLASGKILP